MHSFYFLPVLAILFQGGTTFDINSELRTFIKLCYLPKSPVTFDLSKLSTENVQNKDPLHFVLGNKVIQKKLFQLLTDKADNFQSKSLDKMCGKSNVEYVDDDLGLSSGKIWGFQNSTLTYTCESSKDLPGVQRCKVSSASKIFDEDFLSYFHMINNDAFMEINCFDNAQVGWMLHSQNPSKISADERKYYFDYANALGFLENTNVLMYNEKCDK